MSLKTNIGGSLKSIEGLYTNIDGQLKQITSMYTNDRGILKQIFNSAAAYQWKKYALNFIATNSKYYLSSSAQRSHSTQWEKTADNRAILVNPKQSRPALIDPGKCIASVMSSDSTGGEKIYVVRNYASNYLYYDTVDVANPAGDFVGTVRSETKDFPTLGGDGEYYYVQKNVTFDKYTVGATEQYDTTEPANIYGMYEVSSFQYNPNTKVYDAVVSDTLIDVFGEDTNAAGRAFVQEYTEHPTEIFVCDNAYYDDINVALVFEWTRYYIRYTKGDLVGQVIADADVYPMDGIQDGYWYALRRPNMLAMLANVVWAEDEEVLATKKAEYMAQIESEETEGTNNASE